MSTISNSNISVERLQHDLQKVIPDDVNIVLGRDTDTRTFNRDTICILPHVLDTCPSFIELNEAFRKRLKGMKVPYSLEQLTAIGISCICSMDYTVNHHTVRFLQPTQILNIWGHIETLSVSSSHELSKWLTKSVNRRCQNGYTIMFREDEGIPSFKSEPSANIRKVQPYKDVSVLDYQELPFLHDSATTVMRAAAADSIFLSVSRIHNDMEPLYDTKFPNLP